MLGSTSTHYIFFPSRVVVGLLFRLCAFKLLGLWVGGWVIGGVVSCMLFDFTEEDTQNETSTTDNLILFQTQVVVQCTRQP